MPGILVGALAEGGGLLAAEGAGAAAAGAGLGEAALGGAATGSLAAAETAAPLAAGVAGGAGATGLEAIEAISPTGGGATTPTSALSMVEQPTGTGTGLGAGGGAGTDATVNQILGAAKNDPSLIEGINAGGGGTMLDKLSADPLGTLIGKNPLGAAISGGGLLYSLLKGNQPPQGTDQLKAEAAALGPESAQLRSYLLSGTLPPGLAAAVDQATKAAKARAIAAAAGRGLSTDPTQNSALAADLAAIDQQAAITTSKIGEDLMKSGLSEAQLATSVYNDLVKIDQTQSAQIGQSIANFAAALGGGPTAGQTIKLTV